MRETGDKGTFYSGEKKTKYTGVDTGHKGFFADEVPV